MKYSVIAIEREYGSGGREIGEKLAEKLQIPCYGQEILERAADKLGQPIEELRALEESMTGGLLFSLNMLASITSGRGAELTNAQKLAIAEADIIRDLSINPCVIIGRSAAGLLRDNDNTLKVFIYSDLSARINRAVKSYRLAPEQAEPVLRRFDRRRANYFKAAAGISWHDANTYHMFLNSGKLGVDTVVNILYSAVKSQREQRIKSDGPVQNSGAAGAY